MIKKKIYCLYWPIINIGQYMDKSLKKFHEINLQKCINKSKTSKCAWTLNVLCIRHQKYFRVCIQQIVKG